MSFNEVKHPLLSILCLVLIVVLGLSFISNGKTEGGKYSTLPSSSDIMPLDLKVTVDGEPLKTHAIILTKRYVEARESDSYSNAGIGGRAGECYFVEFSSDNQLLSEEIIKAYRFYDSKEKYICGNKVDIDVISKNGFDEVIYFHYYGERIFDTSHSDSERGYLAVSLGNIPLLAVMDSAELRLEIDADKCNSLAWDYATSMDSDERNGKRAVKLATIACEKTKWENQVFIDTLASAYAEIGNFKSAVRYQQKAIDMLTSEADIQDYSTRLEMYKEEKAYRKQSN